MIAYERRLLQAASHLDPCNGAPSATLRRKYVRLLVGIVVWSLVLKAERPAGRI
jgi:hypothetical protein